MDAFTKPQFLSRLSPPTAFTLVLLAAVPALNMSILLPSLTPMASYFDVEYKVIQFAVSGYLAMTAVFQIVIGPIADKYGRRPVVLTTLALLVMCSIGAALSTTVLSFMIFRMLQAASATGMVMSRAILRDVYATDEAAARIGFVTMGMAIVPMLGPTLGGFLQTTAGWQSVFFCVAVTGLLVFLFAWFDQGETVRDGGLGFAEQLQGYPELFKSVRFWGYSASATFASGAFFALLGGASFVAGTVFHLDPLYTGIALGSPAMGYAVGNGLSGRFSQRVGINKMILWGGLIASMGMAVSLASTYIFGPNPIVFFGLCTVLGVGNGFTMPNATAGLISVRPRLAGTAAGLGGAIMIAGGAILAGVAGNFLNETQGTLPLQWVMLLSSATVIPSILLVMRREKTL